MLRSYLKGILHVVIVRRVDKLTDLASKHFTKEHSVHHTDLPDIGLRSGVHCLYNYAQLNSEMAA